MNFYCPNCQAVPDFKKSEQFKEAVITCAACGTEYHVEGKNIDPQDRTFKQINRIPEGWRVERQPNRIHVMLPSAAQTSWVPLLFAAGFIGVVFYNSYSQLQRLPFGMAWLPFFIALAVGLFLLTNAFRRRIIEITPQQWTLRHSIPKLWGGHQEIPLQSFTQFFVRKVVRSTDDGTVTRYALCGLLKNGAGEVPLLGEFTEPEPLYFLEREIEWLLDIRDKKLPDEYDSRRSIKMTPGKAISLFRAVREAKKK